MGLLKHGLVAAGIVLTVIAWSVEDPNPASWLGAVFAPRFAAAGAGYRTLTGKLLLSRGDNGFDELMDVVTARDGGVKREDVGAVRLVGFIGQAQETMVTDAGPQVSTGPAVDVAVMIGGNPAQHVRLRDPEKALRERFFDAPLARGRSWIFWIGVIVGAVGLVLDVLSERRQ